MVASEGGKDALGAAIDPSAGLAGSVVAVLGVGGTSVLLQPPKSAINKVPGIKIFCKAMIISRSLYDCNTLSFWTVVCLE